MGDHSPADQKRTHRGVRDPDTDRSGAGQVIGGAGYDALHPFDGAKWSDRCFVVHGPSERPVEVYFCRWSGYLCGM
jgi:hypothetical protein